MSTSQYVRCLEGHVYDRNLHASCPKCVTFSRPPEEDHAFPFISHSNHDSGAPSEIEARERQRLVRKPMIVTGVAVAAMLILGALVWFTWSRSPSSSLASDAGANGETLHASHSGVAPSEASSLADSNAKLRLNDSASTNVNAENSEKQDLVQLATSDPKQPSIAKMDADMADKGPHESAASPSPLTFTPLKREEEGEKPVIESTASDPASQPNRFKSIHLAVAELRRVRLQPIPDGFQGWRQGPPKLPLASSVWAGRSPGVGAELQKSQFAAAMHWFLLGASAIDPAVRVGCWENAAYLGSPYAMWALSQNYSNDPVRQTAWAGLASERGVPHVRGHFDSVVGPLQQLEQQLAIVDDPAANEQHAQAVQALVDLIPQVCDIRIASRIYNAEVASQFLSQAQGDLTSIQQVESTQELRQLHDALLEEFELRGAIPPQSHAFASLNPSATEPTMERFPPGVIGSLVLLHRVATHTLSPLLEKELFDQHLATMPDGTADAYRTALDSVAPKLLTGTSAQVAVRLQRQMELNLPDGLLRVAEAPFEEWAAQQGSASSQQLIAQVGMSPEVIGIMQYLMARVADQQKRVNDASPLYEASFMHGMYVAAFDYSKMLELVTESGANSNLTQSVNAWRTVANDCRVLGTSFQKFMVGINDGKSSPDQLSALLNESTRRGEPSGTALVNLLQTAGPESDALRESIGLTNEIVKKMDEPSVALASRLVTTIPGTLDRDGNDRRKDQIAALTARALDQDTWAIFALGDGALPDPELFASHSEQFVLKYEAGRRGNFLAFGSAGRQALLLEKPLGLPPGDKCIYLFAGWLLAPEVSPKDTTSADFIATVLQTALNRMSAKDHQTLRAWMDEVAKAFDRPIPFN